jgi:hypothetical protein
MAAIVLIWIIQLALDFFSNFLGGGLTIVGDLVLGGMQIYLAYRISLVALEPRHDRA